LVSRRHGRDADSARSRCFRITLRGGAPMQCRTCVGYDPAHLSTATHASALCGSIPRSVRPIGGPS
jgi:hypothetical protein